VANLTSIKGRRQQSCCRAKMKMLFDKMSSFSLNFLDCRK
jgi:hypothetical protein